MSDIKNIPNWEVFLSTAMVEKPTQLSDELYCMIFDYNDFEKDINNNWIALNTYLSDYMYNKTNSSVDFLLNLFKTVITEHKVEKYKNEELRDIRLEFHNERLTDFIGWAKFHFEMMLTNTLPETKPMSRRSCGLAYYYISNYEKGYVPLTKKNSQEICERMGFDHSSDGVAIDYNKMQNRTNRTQNSGSTKSNNSLSKDFRLCIHYLHKNGYANANSIAKTELELLLTSIKTNS